jgi:hypothetical protein
MDRERKLAHVIAYYLSRFDKEALLHLGFNTDKEAFTKTSAALGLVPNYIKFRRDEFDVAHPHRLGWHKRPMTLSIINTINALHELDEPTLLGIVKDIILNGNHAELTDDLDRLTSIFPQEKKERKKANAILYVPRGITGRKAEAFFMEWYKHNQNAFPGEGNLKDTRDHGCGYDFELLTKENHRYFIEVKGLSSAEGGIMFTNKEWETAQKKGGDYHLVLVSNLDNNPVINIIANPAGSTNPKRNLITVIQVSWNVTRKDINELIKGNG